MNKKKFIVDILLNFISICMPIFVLQVISLPIVAHQAGADKYGIIITVISIFTIIGKPLGNTLNNVRLINQKNYQESNLSGDFNILLIFGSFLSVISFILITLIYFGNLNFINILLLTIIVLFLLLNDYLIVSYRIKLDYKGIFFYNVLLSFGYLLGTLFYWFFNYWEVIYLMGLIFSFIFLFKTTDLLKEPIIKTKYFGNIFRSFSLLYVSSLLKNILSYADRIILLPLLGPSEVSIYFAASIIGKMFAMVIQPMSNVILSYVVKIKKLSIKNELVLFVSVFSFGIIGYFIIIWTSPFILKLLYSDWAKQSLEIIYITSATAIVKSLTMVINPLNLTYNSHKWQIYINGSNFIIYLTLTLFLTKKFALTGFVIASLMSAVIMLSFQIIVYIRNKNIKIE